MVTSKTPYGYFEAQIANTSLVMYWLVRQKQERVIQLWLCGCSDPEGARLVTASCDDLRDVNQMRPFQARHS